MKKNKEVYNEEESVDDPDEASDEDGWPTKAGEEEGAANKRPHRDSKKREHSEDEGEEDDVEDEDEEDEDEDEEEDESDSDSAKKAKKKRRSKKEEEEDEDDSDGSFRSGIPPKDYTSGAFVVAKADVGGTNDPTLWRIDGKALLQKYLPFKEDGKTLYKSTSTYSGWSVNNKDKYFAAQVIFKVQTRNQTVVELHLDQQQQSEVVKVDKED